MNKYPRMKRKLRKKERELRKQNNRYKAMDRHLSVNGTSLDGQRSLVTMMIKSMPGYKVKEECPLCHGQEPFIHPWYEVCPCCSLEVPSHLK